MDNRRIQQFEEFLKTNPDNALFQYSLGLEYLRVGNAEKAITPLRAAIRLQADYSAAYRELGKALTQAGLTEEAVQTYREGINVAKGRGDLQTAREMRVFLNRLTDEKASTDEDTCCSS